MALSHVRSLRQLRRGEMAFTAIKPGLQEPNDTAFTCVSGHRMSPASSGSHASGTANARKSYREWCVSVGSCAFRACTADVQLQTPVAAVQLPVGRQRRCRLPNA